LFLSGETAILWYLVHSLTQLHRDSVAKERLKRFVAPEVADEILRAPGTTLQANEREVTILFCDISGFTTLSATLPPTEIMGMLNEHFGTLAPIIFKYQGTLEKYIGDALMAIWGAPLAHPDDANRAVRAALEMQTAVKQLNERWLASGRSSIQIHIGIHSGKVAAGNIGSEAYVQYATIGDTTNVASRICDATQPGEILLSASTKARLGGRDLVLTALPPRLIKGKDEPIELYRVEP
jgi:adenylate cyclase